MKTLIVSVQSDYKFPLAEAVRKQILLEVKELKGKNKEVEVLIFTPNQKEILNIEGIRFIIDLKKNIFKYILYFRKFDVIWCIGNMGVYSIIFSLFAIFKEKYITICDGGVFSLGEKEAKLKKLAKVFHIFYNKFFIYTEYQKKLFLNSSKFYQNKLIETFPILDNNIDIKADKYENPTILYMGHLSVFKGLDTLFFIFENLKKDIPNLQLIIANNGIMKDESIEKDLNRLKGIYPNDIIIKGKINPYEELSKAHLYIYLFKKPNGTFAFPLSLYESLLCNTPFLGPNIDGVNEFFKDSFLENPNNKKACLNKAKELISSDFSKIIKDNLQLLKQMKAKLR